MNNIKLHIISFNVPYPPNYGGVVDVFYKIKALHQLGVKIILHSYSYGRKEDSQLDKLTEKTYYYKRDTSILKQLNAKPYIVNSRDSKLLLERLLKDHSPILFEGLHTCYHLSHPQLESRIKIVRAHNIEHDYYFGLAKQEKNVFKRLFFSIEGLKLKRFERNLKYCTTIAAISHSDQAYFAKRYSGSFILSPFHSNDEVRINKAMGDYLLYHGSLDVVENIEAVLFLIETFREEKDIKLIIAGRKPNEKILKAIKHLEHIKLVNAPSDSELKALISNAQINILPTFQGTGVKLKLLEALFSGKHLICNETMINGTNLAQACHLADSKSDFLNLSRKLLRTPFDESDIKHRKETLDENFNNLSNAQSVVNLIV